MKKNKGFTLIELLVVISIIGLLSTIILGSLQQARSKGRNSARIRTLVSLRTALELYYSSQPQPQYPITGVGITYSSETGDLLPNNGGNWIPGLTTSGAISSLPRDPQGGVSLNPACTGGWRRAYLYTSSNGTGYKLSSHCAPEGSWTATNPFYDAVRPSHAWMICKAPDCAL